MRDALIRNFGLFSLALGLPCVVLGVAMDIHIAGILMKLDDNFLPSPSTHRTAVWVQGNYWLAPYLLWIGGALVSLSIVFGAISGLLHSGDDKVTK